jgi:hypothetical protein
VRLCRLAEVPIDPADRVFRYSIATPLFFPLGAIAAGRVFLPRAQWPIAVSYYLAGLFLLILFLTRRIVTARFKSSSWLVRIAGDGVWVQFRSYLNGHLPADDLTCVFLAFADLASARRVTEVTLVPSFDSGGESRRTRKLVELELRVDTGPLAEALAEELARPAPPEPRWYGKSSTLYQHYPVRLTSDGSLQAEWGVVPGAMKFLSALPPAVTVAEPSTSAEDFTQLERLSRPEQEDRLRNLAAGGDTIAAVALARRLYAYDLTEAERFVRSLKG